MCAWKSFTYKPFYPNHVDFWLLGLFFDLYPTFSPINDSLQGIHKGKRTKKNTSGILSSLMKKAMDFIISNASKWINPDMPLYDSNA